MAAFLAAPSKFAFELDLVRPLKNFIQNTYSSETEGEDYTQQLTEFNKLRTSAVSRKLDKHANSLDTLTRYYDQLESIEGKLPICEGQITVNFSWIDAFDKGSFFSGGRKQTLQTAAFERCCTLFNIAAMHSQIGALQNPEDDDGLKTAAKHYQQAAGIFNHLKDTVISAIQNIRTYDLHPDCLQALGAIMLAQAQESFMRKARQDNMKNNVIAKLSSTASDLYADALKSCQVPHVKEVIPKEWIPVLSGKQAYMQCLAEFYQSMVAKDKKSYGEEIARLTHALDLCNAATTKAGQTMNFKDILGKVQRALTSAKKDNDFIYHDVVPKVESLSSIGSAPLAKPTEIARPMNPKSQDMFEKLVPLSVHNCVSAFEARKVEIVSREIGKLRENTQLMNSVLSSLNLPAAIEDLGGDAVPTSLLEKSREIQAKGGLQAIDKLFADLPELLQRNTEILDESFRQLDEEAESDKEMRDRFKERWTRLPSTQLTSSLRTEGGKYRAILNNAVEADSKVREKYNANREYIGMLSNHESQLAAALPPSSAGAALAKTPVVQQLRELMKNIDAIKNEREVIESEIKNTTFDMRTKFLSALASEGVINEEALSNQALDDIYGPLIQQVGDSLRRQEGILNNVQDANTRFSAAKQTNTSAQQREDVQRKLASAYDSYMELTANLQEGTKFYNDLTQLLVKFQSKVSDLCFARRTEKEELLKDLTQSIANQPSGPPPTTPPHHAQVASSSGNSIPTTTASTSQPKPEAKKVPPARPPPPKTTQPSGTAAASTAPPPAPAPAAGPPGYPYGGQAPGGPPYQNPPPAGQQPGGYPTQQYQPMPSYAPYGGYMPAPYNPYGTPPQAPPQAPQGYPQQQYQYPPPQGGYPAPGAPYGQQQPPYNPYQQPPPRS